MFVEDLIKKLSELVKVNPSIARNVVLMVNEKGGFLPINCITVGFNEEDGYLFLDPNTYED